jgi:hypothetical protein
MQLAVSNGIITLSEVDQEEDAVTQVCNKPDQEELKASFTRSLRSHRLVALSEVDQEEDAVTQVCNKL